MISECFYICSGKQDKNTEEDHLDQKIQYKLLEEAFIAMQPSISLCEVWNIHKYTVPDISRFSYLEVNVQIELFRYKYAVSKMHNI